MVKNLLNLSYLYISSFSSINQLFLFRSFLEPLIQFLSSLLVFKCLVKVLLEEVSQVCKYFELLELLLEFLQLFAEVLTY